MHKSTFRRFFAYVLDIIIVTIIVSALANIKFLNPRKDEYDEKYSIYQNYLLQISNGQLKYSEAIESAELKDLTYEISCIGVNHTIITLVVTFLYFVVFQYYTKGKTAGKLLFGIEVMSDNKKDLKFSQLLIRSSIINSLITTSLLVLSILLLSKRTYNNINVIIEFIDIVLIISCVVMVLYRQNGQGLHDVLAKTIVIRSDEKDSYKVSKNKSKRNKKIIDANYEVNNENRNS